MLRIETETDIERLRQIAILLEKENTKLYRRLEHLTEHAEPTRSEVCHMYDLCRRGYAGIVLSDETAIGLRPAHAVERAASLVRSFSGRS